MKYRQFGKYMIVFLMVVSYISMGSAMNINPAKPEVGSNGDRNSRRASVVLGSPPSVSKGPSLEVLKLTLDNACLLDENNLCAGGE